MHHFANATLWTTLITVTLSGTAWAQHGFHSNLHSRHNRLIDTPFGMHHSHSHDRHVVSQFAPQYRGTYSERNGHSYYQPSANAALEEIRFGSFSHVDDLAVRLEYLSNALCLDLHYNYSHNHGFAETYAEAYSILEAARFIHALEHNHQDRAAIQARLGGLDALFHHVQDDVRGWSRIHRRQIGDLGIITKLDLMEGTLHHLMNDVGVRTSAFDEAAPLPATAEVAPPPVPMAPRR